MADLRAPTPSAAAELVAIDLTKLKVDLQYNATRLLRLVDNYYLSNFNDLKTLYTQVNNQYDLWFQQNESIYKTLTSNLINKLDKILIDKIHSFDLLSNKLEALNPIRLLKLGYSQTIFNDKVVTSIEQVSIGDNISVKLVDGKLNCKIEAKKGEKK